MPRSASARLEGSTGASHVAEAGARVEMMRIESDPNSLFALTDLVQPSRRAKLAHAAARLLNLGLQLGVGVLPEIYKL